MTAEVLLGRSLAFCVHPIAAWPRVGARGRLLIVAAYASAGYVAALLTLVAL